VAEIVFYDDCVGPAGKCQVLGKTVMYAAVMRLYTLERNTDADLANAFAEVCFTAAVR
jgi:hypothetical protein